MHVVALHALFDKGTVCLVHNVLHNALHIACKVMHDRLQGPVLFTRTALAYLSALLPLQLLT